MSTRPQSSTTVSWRDHLARHALAGELLTCVAVLAVSAAVLFWQAGAWPGGLHWEFYDQSYHAGLVSSGRLGGAEAEFWKIAIPFYGNIALHCFICKAACALFGTGWDAAGILRMTAVVSAPIVLLAYLMTRVLADRRTALLAALFLLCCPAFLFHARAGTQLYNAQSLFAAGAVGFFLLAHKRRRTGWLVASGWCLSLVYASAYGGFALSLAAFAAMLAGAWFLERPFLLGWRAYAVWAASTVFFIFVSTAALSVFYYGQRDPLFVFKAAEEVGLGFFYMFRPLLGLPAAFSPTRIPADGVSQWNNTLNLLEDFFWGAIPTHKLYEPERWAAVLPFDHLGSTLPGTPGVYPAVAALLLVGLAVAAARRRSGWVLVVSMWLVPFAVMAFVMSYHNRRFILALPYLAATAALGYRWIEERWLAAKPVLRNVVLGVFAGALVLWAGDDYFRRFREHQATLQFNASREAGRWIARNLDPQKDVLVLLDKSVLWPMAIYVETGFKPYQLLVMSEFYFPILFDHKAPLRPDQQEPYDYGVRHYPRTVRYVNMKFPPQDFDLPPQMKDPALQQFLGALRRELGRGRNLYVFSSPAEDFRRESGALSLDNLLMRELMRGGVPLQPAAQFGATASLKPAVVVYRVQAPQ